MKKIKILLLIVMLSTTLTGCNWLEKNEQITIEMLMSERGIQTQAITYTADELSEFRSAESSLQDIRVMKNDERFYTTDSSKTSHEGSYQHIEDMYKNDRFYKINKYDGRPSYSSSDFRDDMTAGKGKGDLKGEFSTNGEYDYIFSFGAIGDSKDLKKNPISLTQQEKERAKHLASRLRYGYESYYEVFVLEDMESVYQATNALAQDFDFEHYGFDVDLVPYTIYNPQTSNYYDKYVEELYEKTSKYYFYKYANSELVENEVEKYIYVWQGDFTVDEIQAMDIKPRIYRVLFGINRGYGEVIPERYDSKGKQTTDRESYWIQLNQGAIKAANYNNHENINVNNPKKIFKGFWNGFVFGFIGICTMIYNGGVVFLKGASGGNFVTQSTWDMYFTLANIELPLLMAYANFATGVAIAGFSYYIIKMNQRKAISFVGGMILNVVVALGLDWFFIWSFNQLIDKGKLLTMTANIKPIATISAGEAFSSAIFGFFYFYLGLLFGILFLYAILQVRIIRLNIVKDTALFKTFDIREILIIPLALFAPLLILKLTTELNQLAATLAYPYAWILVIQLVIAGVIMVAVEKLTGVPIINLFKSVPNTISKASEVGAAITGAGAAVLGGTGNAMNKAAGKSNNPKNQNNGASSGGNSQGFGDEYQDGSNGSTDTTTGEIGKLHGRTTQLKGKQEVKTPFGVAGAVAVDAGKRIAKTTTRAVGNAATIASGAARVVQGGMIMTAGATKPNGGAQMRKGFQQIKESGIATGRDMLNAGRDLVSDMQGKKDGHALTGDIETQSTGFTKLPVSSADIANEGVKFEESDGQIKASFNPKRLRRNTPQTKADYDLINSTLQTDNGIQEAKARWGVNSHTKDKNGNVTSVTFSAKSKFKNKDGKKIERDNIQSLIGANTIEQRGHETVFGFSPENLQKNASVMLNFSGNLHGSHEKILQQREPVQKTKAEKPTGTTGAKPKQPTKPTDKK